MGTRLLCWVVIWLLGAGEFWADRSQSLGFVCGSLAVSQIGPGPSCCAVIFWKVLTFKWEQIIASWSEKQNSCAFLREGRRLERYLSYLGLPYCKALLPSAIVAIMTLSHIISSPLRSLECWRHPEPKTPGEKDRTRGNTDVPPRERTQLFLLVSAAPGGRSEIHGSPPGGEYPRRLRNAKKALFYWIFQRRTKRLKDPADGVGGLCRVLLRQLLPTSVQTPLFPMYKPPPKQPWAQGGRGHAAWWVNTLARKHFAGWAWKEGRELHGTSQPMLRN